MKTCTKCKNNLDISAFRNHNKGKNGIHAVCRTCEKDYAQSYYRENRDDILLGLKNNSRHLKYSRERHELCQAEWIEYFVTQYGKNPKCEICNKQLKWRSSDINDSVHFDHRHDGNEPWQKAPKTFWQNRRCNKDNLSIWKACDFGILCRRCNKALPTIHRIKWLENVIRYVDKTRGICHD